MKPDTENKTVSVTASRKQWYIGSVALLVAALIWGFAFVAQKVGMDYLGPFSFSGVRNVFASIVLLPIAVTILRKEYHPQTGKKQISLKKTFLFGAIIGLFLFIASNLQQVGIQYTTVGKAGFITAMYIVLVPILGLFFGRRINRLMVISIAIAVVGLYLLCINESFSIGLGDGLVLLCALAFAFQIISVDLLGGEINSVVLSFIQFAVAGSLSLIVALCNETITWQGIWEARVALLYAAVMSSGVAFTLQIVGQKRVSPAAASLIMSLESVFSVIGGALLLGDVMSPKEGIGCILMFAAILISQKPVKSKVQDSKNA